uniref:hypothetical protein n=1 Tax=Collinsella sp. TaxID=1965294 RepID=UPI0040261BB8
MKRVEQSEVIGEMVSDGGMTMKDASVAANRNHVYVSNARTKREPSIGTVALIANVYGLDVALIDRETGETRYIIEPPK